MLNIVLIALGGAVGSVLRYLNGEAIYTFAARDFPYATLVVNSLGSLLISCISLIILARFANVATALRSLLIIGLLGGYTTFSAFSFETYSLLNQGDMLKALLNIILSISLCLGATWLGFVLAKSII